MSNGDGSSTVERRREKMAISSRQSRRVSPPSTLTPSKPSPTHPARLLPKSRREHWWPRQGAVSWDRKRWLERLRHVVSAKESTGITRVRVENGEERAFEPARRTCPPAEKEPEMEPRSVQSRPSTRRDFGKKPTHREASLALQQSYRIQQEGPR